MVSTSDILDHLVARSGAPSTMGAQLDRMKYGLDMTPDPFRARDEVESNMMAQAEILRCIAEFQGKQEFLPPTKHKDTGYKALLKVQEKSHGQPQGAIALGVLRAYHERSTASQIRGLVEVYTYIKSFAPGAVPHTKDDDILDLVQSFREGGSKKASQFASELYADALLALQNHCRIWNNRYKEPQKTKAWVS